jgi:ABC-type spermidine/putrescine transport system permease subunit I
MGGSGSRVLTTLIYNQFVIVFNWPLGAALASLLLVLCLATTFGIMRAAANSIWRVGA